MRANICIDQILIQHVTAFCYRLRMEYKLVPKIDHSIMIYILNNAADKTEETDFEQKKVVKMNRATFDYTISACRAINSAEFVISGVSRLKPRFLCR